MNTNLTRVVLFGIGALAWAAFASGGHEAWDRPAYWQLSVPMLLAAQLAAAAIAAEPPLRQPIWLIAGHIAAMVALAPSGSGMGLLPLALIFIGLPAYGLLGLAALLGRSLRRFAR